METAVTILNADEIKQAVTLNAEAVNAVEKGFASLSAGKVSMPPVIRVDLVANRGEVDIKTAYIEGLDSFAIKVASGFFGNPEIGLPYGSGMMVLMSAKTGFLEAILLDKGYLTDLRTGIAGAIAAKYLAPQKVKTVGVIGTGIQARYQLRGLKLVRNFESVIFYGIDDDSIKRYSDEMSAELGLQVTAATSPEEVIRASDYLITTTPSLKPYIKAEWLHKGLHITAMGADGEHKQELYPEVIEQADIVVCDSKKQCFKLGELHHAFKAGYIDEGSYVIELGELIGGVHKGRQTDSEISVCDLTGVGVQDTTIALLTYQKAAELGLGTRFIV